MNSEHLETTFSNAADAAAHLAQDPKVAVEVRDKIIAGLRAELEKVNKHLDFVRQTREEAVQQINEANSRLAAMLKELEKVKREAREETARLDWLELQVVEVRTPLQHGSRHSFWASPTEDDEPSSLRQTIDSTMRNKPSPAMTPEDQTRTSEKGSQCCFGIDGHTIYPQQPRCVELAMYRSYFKGKSTGLVWCAEHVPANDTSEMNAWVHISIESPAPKWPTLLTPNSLITEIKKGQQRLGLRRKDEND